MHDDSLIDYHFLAMYDRNKLWFITDLQIKAEMFQKFDCNKNKVIC